MIVQTFLPFADFAQSAASLDRQRLGKQRVENLQIVAAIVGRRYTQQGVIPHDPKGWRNHPAVRMWRGYLPALMHYQNAICTEWVIKRGYLDTCLGKSIALTKEVGPMIWGDDDDIEAVRFIAPPWLGDPAFHRSHQSNLVRKAPEHYEPQFPGVPADLDYIWPV